MHSHFLSSYDVVLPNHASWNLADAAEIERKLKFKQACGKLKQNVNGWCRDVQMQFNIYVLSNNTGSREKKYTNMSSAKHFICSL